MAINRANQMWPETEVLEVPETTVYFDASKGEFVLLTAETDQDRETR